MGIVVGLGYGVLVGMVLFLIGFLAGSSESSSLMIDPKAILRDLILVAMTLTGSSGAVVGLLVTLFRTGKTKAAIVGFCAGLLVFAGIIYKMWPQLVTSGNVSAFELSFVFLMLLVLLIMFPVGLAATGVTASVLARKFVPPDSRNPSTAPHL